MMMTAELDPPITRCAPHARTPKDQIRMRERPTFEEPQANGLMAYVRARGLSHQSALSKREQEDQAEIMSVALNQPHRRGLPKYQQQDADFFSSELGRFCRAYHEAGGTDLLAYRDSTAFRRYRAGTAFAQIIDDDLVARGLAPRERGDAEWAGEYDDAALAARKELCAIKRRNAEDAIRPVDRRAIDAVRRLCHDGEELPGHLHGLAKNALYRLSLHFGIEKVGFHAAQK